MGILEKTDRERIRRLEVVIKSLANEVKSLAGLTVNLTDEIVDIAKRLAELEMHGKR